MVAVRTPDGDRSANLLGSSVISRSGDRLLVRTGDAARLNQHLVGHGIRVVEIGPQHRGLEEVVLEAVSAT